MADDSKPEDKPKTEAPPEPAKVTVGADEYARFLDAQRRLADVEAENARKLEAKEAERLKALTEKGEGERALTELRSKKDEIIAAREKRIAELESEIAGGHLDATVSKGLLGVEFVSEHAARDAEALLRPRFETARDAQGKPVVREKATGRPAADVIAEYLASPAAAHLVRPKSTGGSGAGGSQFAPSRIAARAGRDAPAEKTQEEILLASGRYAPL